MAYVIRIIGLAIGGPSEVDGTWVLHYTPHGSQGRGALITTKDKSKAKKYATAVEAMQTWREVSRTHPTRMDGKPNRPLSAFTIEVEPE